MSEDDMNDHELLRRLAATVDGAIGDVPADLSALAVAAGRWAVVDEELASIVEDERRAGVRAAGGGGATFTATPFEISASLVEGTLVGEIIPPPDARLEVETPAGSRAVAIDDRGRFRAPATATPYRLRLTHGSRRITTPWVLR